MHQIEFANLLVDNINIYCISLMICGIIFYSLCKKANIQLFDPLTFALANTALADAVPIFLFLENKIAIYDFIYFIFFEILFFVGVFSLNKYWNKTYPTNTIKDKFYDKTIFRFLFIIYTALNIIKFRQLGIPLFMDSSRLLLFQNSGGLGIISRILPFIKIYCLLFCFRKIYFRHLRYILPLIIVFTCDLFDGSKSFVLQYFICLFFVCPIPIRRKTIFLTFILFISIIIINQYIVLEGNIESALVSTGNRFSASGDVYYSLMPYRTYLSFRIEDSFLFLFKQTFAPFKIVDYPPNIGYEIGEWLKGTGEATGPNLRPSILFLLLFGSIGGILGGLIYGVLLSLLIYLITKLRKNSSLLICSFSLYAYITICSGFTGPLDLLGHLLDIVISSCIVIFIYLIISIKNNDKNNSFLSSAISSNSRK